MSADMFSFDEETVYEELKELTKLESIVFENKDISENDINNLCSHFNIISDSNSYNLAGNLSMPQAAGNMSYFWTGFAVGLVGTFFIYSAAAGPISVAIIYFATGRDLAKTEKAAWGCAAGTLLGAGLKYIVLR